MEISVKTRRELKDSEKYSVPLGDGVGYAVISNIGVGGICDVLGVDLVSIENVGVAIGMNSGLLGDNTDDGVNEIYNSAGLGDDDVDVYGLGMSNGELVGHRSSEKSKCRYYDGGMSCGGCNIDLKPLAVGSKMMCSLRTRWCSQIKTNTHPNT